jgi:hypothetical protein
MIVARLAAAAVLSLGLAMPAAAQAPVSIQFPQTGYVTLTARNAPLRTILAEWARVGGSRFVNADRVTGAPLTLELVNVPEKKALETILRGVSGYIVGARTNTVPGTSTFDRVMIVPTAAPIRQAAAPPPTFSAGPTPSPFVPNDPNGDPQGRTPTLLQQQLREAAERQEAARQQNRQEQAEEEEEEQDAPPPAPATRPGPNPFGNIQGSARPGEVNPAPRRNNQPQEDD